MALVWGSFLHTTAQNPVQNSHNMNGSSNHDVTELRSNESAIKAMDDSNSDFQTYPVGNM